MARLGCRVNSHPSQLPNRSFTLRGLTAIFLFVAWPPLGHAQGGQSKGDEVAPSASIEGLVRDIACPVQNKEATATTFNLSCAIQCARRGSPLIILTKEGKIYIPISNLMPDYSQRKRLMPFIGKYVRATGKVYERDGTRAIVIDQINVLSGVHLD